MKLSSSFRLIAALPSSVFTLGDSLVDSKRLNGRFRSGPSYDHPAVSRSPLIELRPREFVVALLRELRPLMRGLGSRAAVRRQTINSCVRIWRMYNDGELPHTMRCLHLIRVPSPSLLFTVVVSKGVTKIERYYVRRTDTRRPPRGAV